MRKCFLNPARAITSLTGNAIEKIECGPSRHHLHSSRNAFHSSLVHPRLAQTSSHTVLSGSGGGGGGGPNRAGGSCATGPVAPAQSGRWLLRNGRGSVELEAPAQPDRCSFSACAGGCACSACNGACEPVCQSPRSAEVLRQCVARQFAHASGSHRVARDSTCSSAGCEAQLPQS